MKTFFTADWHLGHENVIKFCDRPFANAEEMDREIVAKCNDIVGKNDRLIMLGDFTMRPMPELHKYIESIKCGNIILVLGNHDHKGRMKNFFKIYDIFETRSPHIVCCHYAMSVWNKSHRGSYHVYGHSHAGAEDYLDQAFPGRRSMDVGVDNIAKLKGDYRPISVDEVVDILSARSGAWFDAKR